jgi:predicted PhzF superfamily epimerase YddE/YHI9
MSTSVDVQVVRVFCDGEGDFGNELGIVPSSEITRGREQEIARTLGFSETTFVDDEADGTATVRIFTPARELPFAGHPSVGTAWWLASQGRPITVLRVPAGDVAVRQSTDGVVSVRARGSWSLDFAWHELPTPADVDALDPAVATEGEHYYYAWIDEAAGELRARMFAPSMTIEEDEATGSAAVALSARLGRDLRILQGRGSRLTTRHLGDGYVEVGGVTVVDREIALTLD